MTSHPSDRLQDLPLAMTHPPRRITRRRAIELRQRTHRVIEFEVLHGNDAAGPIVDFAGWRQASLVFMATHGRTGIDHFTTGSVTADVVRHIGVPVVMFRPAPLARSVRLPAGVATGR